MAVGNKSGAGLLTGVPGGLLRRHLPAAPALGRLLSTLDGVDAVVADGASADADAHAALGSLPRLLDIRLDTVPAEVPYLRPNPALAARCEDIPLLALHFAGEQHAGFTPEALDQLRTSDWPGNVRQLENAVRSATAAAGSSIVSVRHLDAGLTHNPRCYVRLWL